MCVLRNKGWGQGLEKGGRKRCSDREIIKRERGKGRTRKGGKEEERERERKREREMSNSFCSLP